MRIPLAVRSRLPLAGAVALFVAALAPSVASAEGGATVVGWGVNQTEELGAGWQSRFEPSPQAALGLTDVVSVLSSGNSSYALRANGTMRAWGSSWKGQLGNGSRESSGTPVPVEEKTAGGEVRELTGVTAMSASYGAGVHVMALLNDAQHEGEVATWGASEYGERGNGESGFEEKGGPNPREYALVVPGLKHIVAIAAGGTTDYALQEENGNQTLWAWGENLKGQLGIGEEAGPEECTGEAAPKHPYPCSSRPVRVHLPEGVRVRSLAGGRSAAYAVLSDGTVLAWGENTHAQLGNGSATGSDLPVHVCAVGATGPCPSGPFLQSVSAVSGGDMHALALLTTGNAVGWGSNGTGDLGGTSSDECSKTLKTCQLTPKLVSESLDHITAVSAGAQFSVVINEGKAYALGDNERGQLGIGTWEGPETCGGEASEMPCSRNPLPVAEVEHVSAISGGEGEIGEEHSLALIESAPPPPTISVTPEDGRLVVTWRATLPNRPNAKYTLRANLVTERKFTPTIEVDEACSPQKPCTRTIGIESKESPLVDGAAYEVILTTKYETSQEEREQLEKEKAEKGEGEKVAAQQESNHWSILATPSKTPTITGVSPSMGSAGTTVTITGTNLVSGTKVFFGSAEATSVTVEPRNRITATAPAGSGTVDVTVSNEGGTSATSSADRFTYLGPPPTVTKVKPTSGPASGRTQVTISGTNLGGATAVKFGTVAATKFEVKTAKGVTSIVAESPAHEGGTFDVTVTTPSGTSATSSADHFKFIPTVTSVTPNSGSILGGTSVTVKGAGFALGGATVFKFGSTSATTVNCSSSSECTMTSPKHTPGTVDVKATSNGATSAKSSGDRFTYS